METTSAIFVILGLISALIISLDLISHKQSMPIMNAVWILTAMWGGVIALVAYFWFGRTKPKTEMDMPMDMGDMKGMKMDMPMNMPMNMGDMKGMKMEMPMENHKNPKWQSVTISTLHCGAGCTLADIIGETTMYIFAIAIGGSMFVSSVVIDYILALTIGVYFQYAAIRSMSKLPKKETLQKALKADTLSLTAWQIGMFGFMAIAIFVIFNTHNLAQNSWTFWFMMQIAMMAGFLFALPVNAMLIKKGVKKPM